MKKKDITVKLPVEIYESTIINNDILDNEKLPLERCGIIIGKINRNQNEDILITDLVEDRNPPKQGPFQVFRETSHIYPELAKNKAKDPSIDYIGEWHSHPNGPNCASLIDHFSMVEMIENPLFGDIKWAILLIFTPKGNVKAYYYTKDEVYRIKCEIIRRGE